jgi:hypothetical protein
VFWTVPIRDDAVSVHFGNGQARMTVDNMPITDYFDIPNALFRFEDPVSEPASCSFDIRWSGPITDDSHIKNADEDYAGRFLLNQATMTWSARNTGGFSFVSDPTPTTSAFAQLGHMRNGVFFEP